MSHILLIHQAFVSPNEAGGTRHYEFAQHLVRQGHKVTIIASNLSYLTGQRTIEGNGLVQEQNLNGIRVLRAYTYPSLHKSFVWRVFSFISFMLTSVWAGLKAGPVDLVMGTSPPIFQAVSAWAVALLRRRPFLLEVRDLWPEFAIDIGVLKNPILICLSRWLERFLYARASHIVVNSPAYLTYLIDKSILPEKITLIANGVDTTAFSPLAKGMAIRNQYKLDGKFVIIYAGALGLANNIDTILDAAYQLQKNYKIHFLLVGDGKERLRLETKAKEFRLSNVTFAGSYTKAEMPEVLAAADVCVATLKNIPMFSTTYPNKVFDYMAAGRPTLLAIDGVIREVVEAAGGGVFVPPGDAGALADAVLRLEQDRKRAQAMGSAARAHVVKNFDRQQQAWAFGELVKRLITGKKNEKWYLQRCGKRLIDFISSAIALILLSLPMLMLALVVYLKHGSPVFFCQQRPGLHRKPFTLYKFRTMTDAHDPDGNLLPDAERLTNFGHFLRRTSLDELPELFNVLRGDMSLVGPRPLLMQYLPYYSEREQVRHTVRPGITGLAQISGRNTLDWDNRLALDIEYVESISLWLDICILFKTIVSVTRRTGVITVPDAVMQDLDIARSKGDPNNAENPSSPQQ